MVVVASCFVGSVLFACHGSRRVLCDGTTAQRGRSRWTGMQRQQTASVLETVAIGIAEALPVCCAIGVRRTLCGACRGIGARSDTGSVRTCLIRMDSRTQRSVGTQGAPRSRGRVRIAIGHSVETFRRAFAIPLLQYSCEPASAERGSARQRCFVKFRSPVRLDLPIPDPRARLPNCARSSCRPYHACAIVATANGRCDGRRATTQAPITFSPRPFRRILVSRHGSLLAECRSGRESRSACQKSEPEPLR